MYYRYGNDSVITEKSEGELTGDKVTIHEEDFDLNLYKIVVGYVGPNKELLRYTKFIRSVEYMSMELESIKKSQAENSIDLDFRLSMLELGL